MADLWETHAEWWIAGVHRGRGSGVRRADPAPRGRAPRRGQPRARRGLRRGPGVAAGPSIGADVVIGIDPTWNQIRVAGARGGGPAYAQAGADGAAVPRRLLRRRRRLPRVRAHPRRRRGHRRGRPRPAPRRSLPLLPQPPAPADAEQRLDRRPDPRPARAVLADRPLPRRGRDGRGGREGRVHPVHPPPARPLRERDGGVRSSTSSTWPSQRRPPASSLVPEYPGAASIPRLSCSAPARPDVAGRPRPVPSASTERSWPIPPHVVRSRRP